MSSDTENADNPAAESLADSLVDLSELVESSQDTDFDKLGYHHQHTADFARMPAIARQFRAAGYVLEMVTCQDRRADLDKMRLVYGFNRLTEDSAGTDRHLLHADVDWGQEAASITSVYKAADWHEREVYDMYGVVFSGHPDLKRILLPDDADYHALLKDFGRMEDAPEASS